MRRAPRAWHELSAASAAGLVTAAAVLAGTGAAVTYALALGWVAAVAVYASWVWLASWPLDAEGTKVAAVAEDPSRAATDVILLVAAVASLAAVVLTLADASHERGIDKAVRVGIAVATIASSWIAVHTVFITKYARAHHLDPDEGVDFNAKHPPVWSDFAYLALTVGMTFQVSDTNLRHPRLRRIALRHGVLSYLFGAVIIAVAINLVAGLKT